MEKRAAIFRVTGRPALFPQRQEVVVDDEDAVGHYQVDAAGYVDAATVALHYAALRLGPARDAEPNPRPGRVVGPRQLRDTMGSLVTGVCVVTTVAEGDHVAMTANSVTSVSLDPPLILVCVQKTARFRDALIDSGVWGVSVLDADAAEVSARFARSGRPAHGQFDGLEHHLGPTTGVALLDSSCAVLECRTQHVYDGGDHDIVVGRVLHVEQMSPSVHPLVFHRGRYRWLDVEDS